MKFLFQTSKVENSTKLQVLLKWDFSLGFIVGAVGLLCSTFFAELFHLPENHVILVAVINLMYASFSLWNFRQQPLKIKYIRLLILANYLWPLCCLFFMMGYWSELSVYGIAFYIANMFVVGGLAQMEKKQLT